jgi:hypothetical protein
MPRPNPALENAAFTLIEYSETEIAKMTMTYLKDKRDYVTFKDLKTLEFELK